MKKPLLAFFLFNALFIHNAHALKSDASAPIQIQADNATLNNKTQEATYTGNVFIKQGSIEIKAQKVQIQADSGRLKQATILGSQSKTASFSQTTDQGERITGQAVRIELNLQNNTFTLKQNAKLSDGSNTVSGAFITYNSAKQSILAKKSGNTGRVKMTFLPPEPNSIDTEIKIPDPTSQDAP